MMDDCVGAVLIALNRDLEGPIGELLGGDVDGPVPGVYQPALVAKPDGDAVRFGQFILDKLHIDEEPEVSIRFLVPRFVELDPGLSSRVDPVKWWAVGPRRWEVRVVA